MNASSAPVRLRTLVVGLALLFGSLPAAIGVVTDSAGAQTASQATFRSASESSVLDGATRRMLSRPDTVRVAAGETRLVRVLDRDQRTRGTQVKVPGRFRVLPTGHPSTAGIEVRAVGRRISVSVPPDTRAGTYASAYRLVSKRGGSTVRGASTALTIEVAASTQSPTPPTTRGSLALIEGIESLPVADEHRSGYDRRLFKHWVDADSDGCDARREVLIAESVTPVSVGASCSITGGSWYSYYDGATWTLTGDVDIDHMVALAEAWDSGAWAWSDAQRQAYANDLDLDAALVAVTDNVNQSKSDQDPAEWMPPLAQAGDEAVQCRYAEEWVSVKVKYALSVDAAERSALVGYAADC